MLNVKYVFVLDKGQVQHCYIELFLFQDKGRMQHRYIELFLNSTPGNGGGGGGGGLGGGNFGSMGGGGFGGGSGGGGFGGGKETLCLYVNACLYCSLIVSSTSLCD
jgi:hypothetical protein